MEIACNSILSILQPLNGNITDSTVKRIFSDLNKYSSVPVVLATCLYTFSKVLLSIPESEPQRNSRLIAFRELVAKLISENVLPSSTLYEIIDSETHQLLDPAVNNPLEERRIRTRTWFTQTRFNLFHEETEGYSKLLSLIWVSVNDSHSNHHDLWNNMLTIIGRFRLDNNRIIELILSAATEVLNEQISKRANLPYDHRLPALFSQLLDEFDKNQVIDVVGAMLQTYHLIKTSPESTNGASEMNENSSPQGSLENDRVTPGSLFCLIVVLIREGRMSVPDIWPHLSPNDNAAIVNLVIDHEKQLEELSSEICSNRLTNKPIEGDPRGVFRSGNGPSDRDVVHHYPLISSGPRAISSLQKIRLIAHFINMLRWDDALTAILLLDVNDEHIDIASDPAIATSLTRIVEVLLHPVLRKEHPKYFPENKQLCQAISDLGGRANGCPALIETIDELLCPDEDSAGSFIRQFLYILGPHARVSYNFLQTLCRLLKGRKEPAAVALVQDVILPAAALVTSSGTLVNLIWDIMREWPHTIRWKVYGYIQNVVSQQCAMYRIVADRASYETRYILKRLTADTQKVYAHAMAKITRGQALAAFEAILDRVQGYPPDEVTISPVADACRRCSPLATDILLFMLIDRMADSERSRLKEDGMNIAQWYSTLSLFLGLTLRKMHVQPAHLAGVFSFFYTKLVVEDEPLLVTALSDLINCVSNVDIDCNMSSRQIAAQGGGQYLREVTGSTWTKLHNDPEHIGKAFDFRAEKEKRGAAYALYRTFRKTGIHSYIAIAIAQLTRNAAFQEELRAAPLKLSASIVDRAKTCLMQIASFLGSLESILRGSSDLKYDIWYDLKRMGIGSLVDDMKVSISSACVLVAPIMDVTKILEHSSSNPEMATKNKEQSSLRDTATGEQGSFENSKSIELDDTKLHDPRTQSREAIVGADVRFIEIVKSRTHGLLPDIFIRVFWATKLGDLQFPLDLYDAEIDRLKSLKGFWSKESTKFNVGDPVEAEKKKKCMLELRHMEGMQTDLEYEKKLGAERQLKAAKMIEDHSNHLRLERRELAREEQIVECFLQECMLPRSKISQPDALVCYLFIFKLLQLDIPSLNYGIFFKQLMHLVPITLQCSTENEALSFTYLIKEIITTLEKWRSNRKMFETEASNGKRHGFTIDNSAMPHEHFCQWLYDIHQQLTEGLCKVLMNEEYMNIRNALTLLIGISEVFPKVSEHSSMIEKQVNSLTQSNLPDVKLSSKGVLARLQSGRARRLPEHIFKLKPASSKTTGGITRGTTQGTKVKSDDLQRSAGSSVKEPLTKTTPIGGATPMQEKKPSPSRVGNQYPVAAQNTAQPSGQKQDVKAGNKISPNNRKRPAPVEVEKHSSPPKKRGVIDDKQPSDRRKPADIENQKGKQTGRSERQKPPPAPGNYDRQRSLQNEQSRGGQGHSRQPSPKKGGIVSGNGNDSRDRPASQFQNLSNESKPRLAPRVGSDSVSDGGSIRERGLPTDRSSSTLTRRRPGDVGTGGRSGTGESGHNTNRMPQGSSIGKRSRNGQREPMRDGRDVGRGVSSETPAPPLKKIKGSIDDRRSPRDGELESRKRRDTPTGSYDYERGRGRFDSYNSRYEENRLDDGRYQRPSGWSNMAGTSSTRERDSRRYDGYVSHRREDEYWQDRDRRDRERDRNDKRHRNVPGNNGSGSGLGNATNNVIRRRRRG